MYCPKLCSHTCPVSGATHRETLTPWGKQTVLWEMRRGMLPTSQEYVQPLFACTQCHACREACDHGVDVAASLSRGREAVFDAGLLPEPVRRMLKEQPSREREARRSIEGLETARRPAAGTRVVLFPGCRAAIERRAQVQDAVRVLTELSGGSAAVYMDACCGLPHLQAGDVAGFVQSARRLAEGLRGLRSVVVLDPGCLHTIRRLYPEHGIEVETPTISLPEFVLPHVHRFVRRTNPRGPVFYHDPCHLGRGLGVYDAPRELLLRLVAGGARDLHTSREKEPCCGGGGAILVSMPEVASAAADHLASRFAAEGARTVVTACPTCEVTLSGHTGIDVVDIVTLMARAL